MNAGLVAAQEHDDVGLPVAAKIRLFFLPMARVDLVLSRAFASCMPSQVGEDWRHGEAVNEAENAAELGGAEDRVVDSLGKINAFVDWLADSGLRVTISILCPGVVAVLGFTQDDLMPAAGGQDKSGTAE